MTDTLAAVICTKNEADNIAACIASVKGVDEVVVADDGSTDDTVSIAESLGARVFQRQDWSVRATAKDVREFKRRFGWAPEFKAGDRIRNGHHEQMEAVLAARTDFVVCPDADERVTWDLPRIRAEVLPVADQVICDFVHAHDENGDPVRVSTITKMFRRAGTTLAGRTHGVILPTGRIVKTDLMRVDHWQKPGHTQSYVLPILEYCVLKEDDQRSRFYLGREYYYRREYDRCLTLLDMYLERATWMPEIAQARLYAAHAYYESGRGDEARKSCLEAVLINPDHQDALLLMSELYFEPWRSKWAFIASNATNKDILF
jgi:glycosyltransferase involved in cell wall biosynthesis